MEEQDILTQKLLNLPVSIRSNIDLMLMRQHCGGKGDAEIVLCHS